MKKYIEIVSMDEIPSVIMQTCNDRLMCEVARPEDDLGASGFPSVLSQPAKSVAAHKPAPVVVSTPEPTPKPAAASAAVPRSVSVPAAAPPKSSPAVRSTSGSSAPKPEPPKKVSIFNPTAEFRYLDHYDRDQIIDGVFHQIIREQRNDWHNYVYLSGGGTKEKMLPHLFEFDADHLFEYHWDNYDSRERIKPANAWLQVQFPFHSFVLTHYTIATSGKQFPFNSQPRSWNLEGSADGKNWTLLAQVRREDRFKEQTMALATFSVPRVRQAFTHFKLTQLENFAKQGAANYGEMRINAIEFYGTLYKR
jgi:hypothetical protein